MRSIYTAVVLISLFVSSCKNEQKKNADKVMQIPTIGVEKKDLKLANLYVADIQAVRNVEIRSRVDGYIEAIYVDEGKVVKEGQILFKLHDNEYKNEIVKAKALLNIAKADKMSIEVEHERVKMLVDKKVVTPTELALAESKLKAAASRVEEAVSNLEIAVHRLSYTIIRAPFDGVVDRIPLKPGSFVSEGALITSVSDISSVFTYFNISENEYLKYKRAIIADTGGENRSASLILSDGREYDQKGKIETVVSEFEESTGSIAFRARFPNPGQLLRHNATGKIKLLTVVEDALLIPQKSTFEIQDKCYVFVVGKDNVIHMRHFIPAGRSNECYLVSSGLSEGDVIVYEGIQSLKDGMKIQPLPYKAEPVKTITAL